MLSFMSEWPSITCPQCGMTSHNINDVRERYCGNCRMFHENMREDSRPIPMDIAEYQGPTRR